MNLPLTATLLWLSLSAAPVWAQVYKCQAPGGTVSYSQQPCPPGAPGQAADVRPNTLDASGQREQARRLLPEPPAGAGANADGPAAEIGRAHV